MSTSAHACAGVTYHSLSDDTKKILKEAQNVDTNEETTSSLTYDFSDDEFLDIDLVDWRNVEEINDEFDVFESSGSFLMEYSDDSLEDTSEDEGMDIGFFE